MAAGRLLLFLHADSRFTSSHALTAAVSAYSTYQIETSPDCAARFKLRFRRSDSRPSLQYYYHEAKARLNRGDCIRGDQGYLMDRAFFERIGRFDETLPYLEDVRLAALIARRGAWLLLPAEITTSARRFEQEGFYARQVANAVIINALETGWGDLLASLPGLYRSSCTSGRLSLHTIMSCVSSMIKAQERTWQKRFWHATGVHVAANAWQIFFWLDIRRMYYSGRNLEVLELRWFNLYSQLLESLFTSYPASRLAEVLTRIWLRWVLATTGKRQPCRSATKTSQTG